MSTLTAASGPLEGTRVLDLCDGLSASTGLFLAELGAEVILVEPPTGFNSRRTEPVVDGVSVPFAVGNAGKHSVTLDLATADGRRGFISIVHTADIVFVPARRGDAPLPTSEEMLKANPKLVVVSISPFGAWGPYREFVPSEAVYMGLNGMIAHSGRAGLVPLIPPRGLVENSAGLQAAWAALVALHKARATGEGEHVDLSIFEASAQVIDPPFGAIGSARAMIDPEEGLTGRGRPDMGYVFPTVRCQDGFVRIAFLGRRQWLALWEGIGSPEQFGGEEYHDMHTRLAAWPEISGFVSAFFGKRTVEELMRLGVRHSFPIGEVYTPDQALAADHIAERGVFADFPLADGQRQAKLATGYVEIDGARWPRELRLPDVGRDNDRVLGSIARDAEPPEALAGASDRSHPAPSPGSRPLAGLRILDLGVIVVGAETGRLLADVGADVVKVENLEFPDVLRVGSTSQRVSAAFAWGHRNKRSIGVDLRTGEGRELFRRLVAEADAVVSNFKPGTLDQLGIGYSMLAKVNPRIVVGESSAYGATGPWAGRMGFGPLVRASVGLSEQWRYAELPDGFGDDVTVFPDHANGRVMAAAVLASVDRARHTGQGCHIRSAQSETVINVMAATYFQVSLRPGTAVPIGNLGLFAGLPSLYRCAGEDEWAVIDVQTTRHLHDLLRLTGGPLAPELAHDHERAAISQATLQAIEGWAATRSPYQVMWACQDIGIPAAPMLRPEEMLEDPHLKARGHFTTMDQAGLPVLPSERGPAKFSSIAQPALAPAPRFGEHTRQVLGEWLGLRDVEIDRLFSAKVLQGT